MLVNTRTSYGLIAQLLHWLTAALVLVLIPLGLFMHELPAGSAEEVAYKSWYYSLHKTLGVAAFLVAVTRVGWAIVQPRPAPLNGDRKLESFAAQTVHWMLYGAIILMPPTGWLHHSAAEGFAPIWWPFSQDLPFMPKNLELAALFGAAHYFTAILLGLSIALHIAGALKHVVIDRDGTLARMVPGMAPRPNAMAAANPGSSSHALPGLITVLAFLAVAAATMANYTMSRTNATPARVDGEPSISAASGWRVNHAKSQLAIQIVQSGSEITGHFGHWDAVINFDPQNLNAARVAVKIDITSLSLGGVSQQAISADFLNAATYPIAMFESDTFLMTGESSYEAHGQLSLAGERRPLVLPFILKIENERATVEGVATIRRLDFGIGEKGFPKDDMVGFEVLVKVNLEASKASPP
jgi:cytochrome b561/polyisoprenoid-binding protein YceI